MVPVDMVQAKAKRHGSGSKYLNQFTYKRTVLVG